MPITRKEVENALSISLDENVSEENDVTKEELAQVKKSFDRFFALLEAEASTDEDEDDEDDEEADVE